MPAKLKPLWTYWFDSLNGERYEPGKTELFEIPPKGNLTGWQPIRTDENGEIVTLKIHSGPFDIKTGDPTQ